MSQTQFVSPILEALLGQVRARILGLLLDTRVPMTLTELAEKAKGARTGVRLQVEALEALGLVIQDQTPRGTCVRANDECTEVHQLRNLVRTSGGAARLVAQELADHTPGSWIFIYGPYAAGRDGPSSDIRVMLISEEPRGHQPFWARVEGGLSIGGREVEIEDRVPEALDNTRDVSLQNILRQPIIHLWPDVPASHTGQRWDSGEAARRPVYRRSKAEKAIREIEVGEEEAVDATAAPLA